MRKILSSIMLVAVAAMASVSCQKEEAQAPVEPKSTTLTLHANVEETKTYIDGNTVLWGTGEYVQLYFNNGTDDPQFVKSNDDNADVWNESDEAMFSFDITYNPADSYTLGGVYPLSAVSSNDAKTSPEAYKVDLPATQDATASSYDPAAFIMIMKPETIADADFDKDGHIASFRRAAALNKITLEGLKETITSVTITVPEEKFLAGRRYFDLTTGKEGEIYHAQSNSITVNGTYVSGEANNVWFTSWGVELAHGEQMTIKMTSATKTYTRTITVNENGIKFIEGNLNTLTVNMSSAEEIALNDFSGEYLIVNKDFTRAAQAWNNGNNLPEYELTLEDGTILESEGLENCKMTIELQSNGKYTIKDAKNNYLYAPSSSNNYLNGLAEASELTDWNIVQEGDKYVLTSLGNNSRNILRYNSSSKIFSCYSSGQADVTLYRYSEIKPDTRPSVSVTETTNPSIGAEGGDLTFTCTIKNLDGETLEVVEESDYLTWAVAENVVTITVAANETAESRILSATIKCGSVEVPVTINQAAAGSAESGWISKTFAELEAGDQVVIVATKGSDSWALSDANGTSKAPAAVTITYSDDKLTSNPSDEIIWYVGGDAEGRIFYADAANGQEWLYCTSSNNGVRVGINSANTFVLDATSGYLKHEGTGRYVGVYTTTPDWRCYTNTTGNTVGQTFKFFVKSGDGGVVTPDPTPDPEEPSTGVSKTAKITFGSNAVKINAASVTGTDSENNNWTITTVGTTSYTSNSGYYQVGSSSKPATSITFTTTLPAGASVSNVEAKFGGFNGTAGTVTLKVGDTSVGAGNLNASSDVTVNSISTATGNVVTVTVTDISKGVKCYYISVNYTE